jgi:hypothetical protein
LELKAMKSAALSILLVLLSSAAVAQPRLDGGWLHDPGSRCWVWDPEHEDGITIAWFGAACRSRAPGERGYAEGEGGVTLFLNGREIQWAKGFWRTGRQVGRGLYGWSTGEQYEGEFANGLLQGWGRMKWPDRTTYEGDWKSERINGFGDLTLPNGDRYKGDFRNGLFSGKGRYTWASGDWYEGMWSEGRAHGPGVKHTAGRVFNGQWTKGCWIDGGEAVGVPYEWCGRIDVPPAPPTRQKSFIGIPYGR